MSSTSSEITKWKDKYYNSLDDIEVLESSAQEDGALYSRALTRLSLATKGYNENLDPHLLRLRKQLKQETKTSNIRKSVASFSEILLKFSDSEATKSNHTDSELLFEYLLSQDFNKAKLNHIKSLQTQYKTGKLSGSKQLISLITETCSSITEQVESLTVVAEEENTQHISNQFIQVLQGLDLPEASMIEAKKIIKSLQNEQADDFQQNVQIALDFLQEVNVHTQHEKKEMELFLAHVTQQLANLGENTRGVSHVVQQVMVKRNNLDQTVSRQVQDLQKSSESTTQLEPLKTLIKSELDNISEHIKRHQQEEKQLQAEAEKRFNAMTSEIDAAKKETSRLKESLKQASAQAITDALTSLPNRIAYDQR